MRVVRFRYRGRFGHFLRAEANVNGLTSPVPPRTVLLGVVGAVLGMPKDSPQVELADAKLAVAGASPKRFWHKAKVRKDPPAALPYQVKSSSKGSSTDERAALLAQEWLFRPDYQVWAALPEGYHPEMVDRLRDRRWHFTPSLGLSEMLADLEFEDEMDCGQLPEGVHEVGTVVPRDAGEIDTSAAHAAGLTVQSLRMPRSATAARVFTHASYWLEFRNRPLPVNTSEAWDCGGRKVVFL